MLNDLLCCKQCGNQAYESFIDNHDLGVTVNAVIECSVCSKESHTFALPDDQSAGNKAMGPHIEQLARLHWNMIKAT